MKQNIFRNASPAPCRLSIALQKALGLCAAFCLFAVLLGCRQSPAESSDSTPGSGSSPAAESSESAGNTENSDSSPGTPAAEAAGLPDSSRIAVLEALYGQGKEAVLEALEVTEDTESPMSARGMWSLQETAALEGVDFSQALLYNAADETLYGVL